MTGCAEEMIFLFLASMLLVSFQPTADATDTKKRAFLIVDVQNCFVNKGTLPVNNGGNVVAPINKILAKEKFEVVVRTQDWHCKNHVSFASQHPGHNPFSSIDLSYTSEGKICNNTAYKNHANCSNKDATYKKVAQTLWPDHCVINSTDAEFLSGVNFPENVVTVRKGYHCEVDSYSGFKNNGGFSSTELDSILKRYVVDTVYVAGLATDYCVSYTAKDAVRLGYESYVVLDATAAIANDTLQIEKAAWKTLGVKTITTDELIGAPSSALQTSLFGGVVMCFLLAVGSIKLVFL